MNFCDIPVDIKDTKIVDIQKQLLFKLNEYIGVKDLNKIIVEYCLTYDSLTIKISTTAFEYMINDSDSYFINMDLYYQLKINHKRKIPSIFCYTYTFIFYWFYNRFYIKFKEKSHQYMMFKDDSIPFNPLLYKQKKIIYYTQNDLITDIYFCKSLFK